MREVQEPRPHRILPALLVSSTPIQNHIMSPLRFSCPASVLLFVSAAIAQITPGNLAVVRVGDGTAALGSTATVAFVDQFDRNVPGAALSSLMLPTAISGGNQPVTLQGTATSEGFLTQSADGNYVLVTGYAAIPGAASPNGATSAAVNRVIARIDLSGNVDSSTALTDAHNAGSIRSAVSIDGTSFWTSGAGNTTAGTNRGMTYVASLGATTSIQVPATITNGRVAAIFDGQLYVSTAAGGTFGISAMGTGLPTTSGQTSTLLNGFATPTGIGTISQYDFWFADAQTVYVADDRTAANGGGIQKWIDVAGTWTFQYTLSPGAGCRGVSGIRDLSGTTIYATTAVASANNLVSVLDTGAGSTFTTLATAATNTAFRGVRFVRTPSSAVLSGLSTCPTSAGTTTIGTAGGQPVSGNASFGIAIGNTPPVSLYITVIAISPIAVSIPLTIVGGPLGCDLHTPSLDILLAGVTDLGGAGVLPLSLAPADAGLWGAPLVIQHLVFDAAFYPTDGLPTGVSDSLQIVIGN